ncbi:uncharacterized protein LOC18422683 [Amborella trichopoda]|uniref:uncharacterized protein LOC18422683 n=1 Tax=Amborella trichopoda TaxID=13333 RepID=UPI0005D44239|nr:uncharacterized protein LOC18422683 [Amborella trichopoda]|eukprot:XP_011624416.1 uncharacterized protein LOC18422683 [Amborella trichopoda]
MMGLLFELLANVVILITKPFSIIKLSWQLGAEIVGFLTITWMRVVKLLLNLYIAMCWRIIIWTVSIISLPFRILTAIQRERLLETHLLEMQAQLEMSVWQKKELEERLTVAVKQHKIVESILAEVEEEHDKAITKIEVLENELQDLREENIRLKEIHFKHLWKPRPGDPTLKYEHPREEYGTAVSWDPGLDGSNLVLKDLMQGTASHQGQCRTSLPPFGQRPILQFHRPDEVVAGRRGLALKQSLFSAFLSLLVGTIVWEAEDPCGPLVAALFSVVGMSLKSVVSFFSTLENRAASDAVALLSLNCFILGTLTAPTLPSIARLSTPPVIWLACRAGGWFAFAC